MPSTQFYGPDAVRPRREGLVWRVRFVEQPSPDWSAVHAAELESLLAETLSPPSSVSLLPPREGRPGAGPGPQPPVPAGPAGLWSSEAAPPPPAPPRPGFWFNVNAELIVYGATEPDAHVTIDGEPIRLRPDGSFTLRFALPDGDYALRAKAVSVRGDDARVARLAFRRRTAYHGEVGPHPTSPALTAPPAEPGAR